MAKIKQLKLVDATEIYPKASFDSVINTSDSDKTLKDTLTEYYGPLSKGEGIDGTQDTIEGRLYLLEEEYSDTTKYRKFVKDIKDFGARSTSEGVQLSINTDIQPVVTGDTHSGEPLTTTIPLVTTTTNGIMSSSDKNKLDSIEGDSTPLSDKGIVVDFYSTYDTTITITDGACPVDTFTKVNYNTQKNVFYVTASRKNYTVWNSNADNSIPSSDIYNTDLGRAKHIFKRTSDNISFYFKYAPTTVSSMNYYTLEELREVTINLPELDYPKVLPYSGVLSLVPTIQSTSTAHVDAIYYIYEPNSTSNYNKTFVASYNGSYYMSWSTEYHNNHEYNTHPRSNMYVESGTNIGVIVDTGEMVNLTNLNNYL